MSQGHQVIISHCFYKSQLCIDGWLIASFYGPFHRDRCLKSVEAAKLKAEWICIHEKEKIKDERNIEFFG